MKEENLIKKIIDGRKSKNALSNMLIKAFPDLGSAEVAYVEPHSLLKNISMNAYTADAMNINTGLFNQGSCRFINIALNLHTKPDGKQSYKVKITPYDDTDLQDGEVVLTGTINCKDNARGNKIGPAISKRINDRKKQVAAQKFDDKNVEYLEYVNSFIKTHLNKKVTNISAITLNILSTTNLHQGLRRSEMDEHSALIKFEFKSRVYCILFVGSCVICSKLDQTDTGFKTTINLRKYFKNDDSVLNDPESLFINPDKREITKLNKQITSLGTKKDKEIEALKKEIRAKNKAIKKLEKENTLLRNKAASELAC